MISHIHPAGYAVCDFCPTLSKLYETFPHCRTCGENCCPDHVAKDSLVECDGRETCLCQRCADEDACVDCGRWTEEGDGRVLDAEKGEYHCERCIYERAQLEGYLEAKARGEDV